MIAPGMMFTPLRVLVTLGDGIVPDRINNGFGFMNDGSLAIDTGTPTGNLYNNGFRMSPNGAVYGVEG